jgi:hypothetical protein
LNQAGPVLRQSELRWVPSGVVSNGQFHAAGKLERFCTPRRINGRMAIADGPIKTFPLWGIKGLPPYPYHGRSLTLEDTGEFFNVVLGIQLTAEEKQDLLAFLRVL